MDYVSFIIQSFNLTHFDKDLLVAGNNDDSLYIVAVISLWPGYEAKSFYLLSSGGRGGKREDDRSLYSTLST